MTSRIIFHCGLPKTGTTAIQQFFSHNQEVLRPFLLFPGPNEEAGNASWMVPLIWENRIAPIVDYCKTVLEPEKILLFSSEDLYHALRISPDIFAKLIRELDASIILYLPSMMSFMVGSLKQLIRNHCHTQLNADARLKVMCNYTEPLIYLYRQLGKERMRCFLYDRSQFPSGDVVAHFLQAIGLEVASMGDLLGRLHNPNTSLRPLALGLLVHVARGGMTLLPEEKQMHIRNLIQSFADASRSEYIAQSILMEVGSSPINDNNERLIRETFEFSHSAASITTNNQICFPIQSQCWQDFIDFTITHDPTLERLLSRLHANSLQHEEMIHSPPGMRTLIYSTTELGFILNQSNYNCWGDANYLSIDSNGSLHIKPCDGNIFVNLPRAYPISHMTCFLEIHLLEPTESTPYVYWSTEITPYLSHEHCKPMQLRGDKIFRADITHPLFNGILSIRFSSFSAEIIIVNMQVGFFATV